MSQGLFAGGTDYQNQSLDDIRKDIEKWVNYSQSIENFFEEHIQSLKKIGYWIENVPFNFRVWCEKVIQICRTITSDFNLILIDIKDGCISLKTINLMNNIGKMSHENYNDFRKAYKEDSIWKDYGNNLFKEVEELYAKASDFFATLWDVNNASYRLKDYMSDITQQVNINIGDNNIIKASNIGLDKK